MKIINCINIFEFSYDNCEAQQFLLVVNNIPASVSMFLFIRGISTGIRDAMQKRRNETYLQHP